MQSKIKYAPHLKQRDFHSNDKRFRALIGGIGSGKTKAGSAEAVAYFLSFPVPGMVVAPTYRMLNDITQRTFMEICPPDAIANEVRSEDRIIGKNGAEVWFRSADDPEKLRGPNIGWIYVDEAALVSHMAWKILMGRLRLEPGKMWITTTPKGYNWVYKEFAERERPEYSLIHVPTKENPYLPKHYIQSLEESYTGFFAKQELEGLFTAAEGLVYPGFNRFVHVTKEMPVFKDIIAGVDWGYNNPSVILVIGIDSDDNYWVVDEFYEKRVMMDTFVAKAQEFKERYHISKFYCDPAEPRDIQTFVSAGLNAIPADNEKMPGINKVASKLVVKGNGKASLYLHAQCVHTLTEFETYQYPEQKEGKTEKDEPIKAYDHAMDALRYALYSRESNIGKMMFLEGGEGLVF